MVLRKKERDHLLYLCNMDTLGITKKYNPNTILTNWVAKRRQCEEEIHNKIFDFKVPCI